MKKSENQNKILRKLSDREIELLKKQGNVAIDADWPRVRVAQNFSGADIFGCTFSGDVEIGEGVVMRYAHIIADDGCDRRINIINENGGRAIVAFKNLSAACVSLWSKFRGDTALMEKFADMSKQDTQESAKTIIGDGAYIGHAVQIRNSIIGEKNVIDSAAQLENVMTCSNVSIKNAARIFHSVVGSFSHIACCEIANVFVGAFHGQHHNNSFLIAASVGGLSNVAAGATVGSNHNSRMYDGEIWAARGFWPGLNVSLKHNSRFASYSMIANGRYNSSLDVRLPFSLVAENKKGNVEIYPAFLLSRNLYSLMRNNFKFAKRLGDGCGDVIEHDFLAPDTIDEMFDAIKILESDNNTYSRANVAVDVYKLMIRHYCAKTIFSFMSQNNIVCLDDLCYAIKFAEYDNCKWKSFGTFVINDNVLSKIIADIKSDSVKTMHDVNLLFDSWQSSYKIEKVKHALNALAKVYDAPIGAMCDEVLKNFAEISIMDDYETIVNLTTSSRAKDYTDTHRTMVYDSQDEQDAVLGTIDNDPVIMQVKSEKIKLQNEIETVVKRMNKL